MYKGDAMWEMNSAHHKELLKVAETQRSLARIHKRSHRSRAHVLHTIGDTLVSVGARLKARYAHMTHEVA
jgi:Co/Zn/Cd efflux system component